MPDNLTAAVVNHLWQSTGVAAIAWLLAVALKKNDARVRYWVWMAASVKFLLPFSLLKAAGEWMRWLMPAATVARQAIANVMEQVTQPFDQTQFLDAGRSPIATHHGNWLPAALVALWVCGVLVVALRFARGWCAVYAAKRGAMPIGKVRGNRIVVSDDPSTQAVVDIAAFAARFDGLRETSSSCRSRARNSSPASRPVPIHKGDPVGDCFEFVAEVPVLSSPEPIEPGVVGIFRPALLMPEGILEKLTAEQMRAVLAHEVFHVRRRDNLTFAIHMVVEALFWFHPLVWWIGARLIDERERACDEAVAQAGVKAEVYAEGILSVCKFFAESPLACVSGVTGADLKKRIVRIMTDGRVTS